uniref:Major facilitator superfamily associated domain-containing protein n=1 Tax=Aureoumbra lagunensis TaxID=44058 RepID=A0A7S3NF87_9STRA|mmetsp:Transcript_13813/g.18450  ORF Transcript_13813/g.18450 Transcript_13813/m.18450 type:complete len:648 (-) Transcript_13813:170-2113(-)
MNGRYRNISKSKMHRVEDEETYNENGGSKRRRPKKIFSFFRFGTTTSKLTTFDAKVLSFAYSASSVAWNRFCSLWLLKCGFSPRQVGFMKSLSLVGKLSAQPAWAAAADSGSPPHVLTLSIVLSVLALELLRVGTRDYYDLKALGRATAHRTSEDIPGSRFWTLLGLSSSSKETSHHAMVVQVAQDVVASHLFLKVSLLRLARSASSAASPVADAMVLALARDGGEAWGKQRFWGSASWGLGSVAVGALIDRCGLEIGLFAVSHLASLCLLSFLITRLATRWHRLDQTEEIDSLTTQCVNIQDEGESPNHRHQSGKLTVSLSMRGPLIGLNQSDQSSNTSDESIELSPLDVNTSIKGNRDDCYTKQNLMMNKSNMTIKKKKRKNLCSAMTRGLSAVRDCAPLRLALANSVCFGTLVVSVDSILYMQLENELAVSRTLSGLATALATAATFPVFWTSADIVQRYGYWRVIALAQCVLPVRLLLHACVTKSNVWYVLLPTQLLHGPMFAAWISAAVELVDRLAPVDLRASTQSLLTMAYFTLGGCLGHLLWSTTFELYGGRTTYILASFASMISVLVFAFFARHHLRHEEPVSANLKRKLKHEISGDIEHPISPAEAPKGAAVDYFPSSVHTTKDRSSFTIKRNGVITA